MSQSTIRKPARKIRNPKSCSPAEVAIACFSLRAQKQVNALFDESFLLSLRHEGKLDETAMAKIVRGLEMAAAGLADGIWGG